MEQIDKQSFSIRLANKEDAWAMYQVEKNSFATPWSYDNFAENVRHGLSVYFLAEYSGQVVGFGGMLIVMEEAHIMNVAVLPNFRKKGIGRALLQAMIAEAGRRNASAMFLEARVSNQIARSLYRSAGFAEIAVRKEYYTDTREDAVIMRLEIGEQEPLQTS